MYVNLNYYHRLSKKWYEAKQRKIYTLGYCSLPLLKHFCSPYSEFHSKNGTTEIVTPSVLLQGTFRLTRRLLNIRHSLEVLTKTQHIYKSCQMTRAYINQSAYAEGQLLRSKHLPQECVALEL